MCHTSFHEREIPRRAGFKWNPFAKHWETESPYVAAKLRAHMSVDAENEIKRILLIETPWLGRLSWPKGLTPKVYQREDAKFCLRQNRSYLALDPGLGKTAIAALIHRALLQQNDKYKMVYVCPPFLQETVIAEFEKWGARDGLILSPDSKIDRPVTKDYLKKIASEFPVTLLIDEAHRFKTDTAKRSKAIFEIAKDFPRVVLMSGTPMPNRPMELYPILINFAPETIDFVNKFQFGIKYCAGFQTQFGWDFSGASNLKELGERVKGKFMRRRKKEDVLKELPPKTEEIVLVGENLPKRLGALDRKILRVHSPEDLMGHIADNGHVATYRRELGQLKVKPTVEIVNHILKTTDEKILLFAIHINVVSELEKRLAKHKPIVVSGKVPTGKRAGLAKIFQTDPKRRLWIGNIAACGLGFTLTAASRVLFAEFSWVPGENDQASDRAHRIGQLDNVFVQYLVFKNSIDRTVLESMLRKKQNQTHV